MFYPTSPHLLPEESFNFSPLRLFPILKWKVARVGQPAIYKTGMHDILRQICALNLIGSGGCWNCHTCLYSPAHLLQVVANASETLTTLFLTCWLYSWWYTASQIIILTQGSFSIQSELPVALGNNTWTFSLYIEITRSERNCRCNYPGIKFTNTKRVIIYHIIIECTQSSVYECFMLLGRSYR